MILGISCEREPSEIGMDFKTNEKIGFNVTETFDIQAFTYSIDSVRSDNPLVLHAGQVWDKVFGKTNASFLAQLRLARTFSNEGTIEVDSVKLFMLLDTSYVYGDPQAQMDMKVYELNKKLDYTLAYYSNMDVSDSISSEVLNQNMSDAFTAGDTIIEIFLNTDLGVRLLDSTILATQANFQEEFKGLYVEAHEQVPDNGAIASFALKDYRSRIEFYYRDVRDTIIDSLVYVLPVDAGSRASVNLYEHDHSLADPAWAVAHLDEEIEDTVMYVQGMGGMQSVIRIPGLESWADSTPVSINKAELIIPLADLEGSGLELASPGMMKLTIKNSEGSESYLYDNIISGSSDYFGGIFSEDADSIRFNIASHVQYYINEASKGADSDIIWNEFYLQVVNGGVDPGSVVFKSPSAFPGMRFRMIYSRLDQ